MSVEQSTIEYRELEPLGYPGYRVGSDGTVWSRNRRWRTGTNDRPLNEDGWRRLKPHPNGRGHLRVRLKRFDGAGAETMFVHRLVLLMFIGPCPDGCEACHFPERDPTNNSLTNLRWDTKQANHADRLVHGTECRGEKHVFAKLKTEDVRFIRANVGKLSHQQMARMFGVTKQLVFDVIHRKSWAWLL